MKRRHFVQISAATAAWGAIPVLGQKSGKRYRTALIGSGWWGMNILREAMASGQAECVALCDVDETVVLNAADDMKFDFGDEPKTYRDYRDLLAEAKPEIVIIATPDHWHALQTIAAVESGAHVFVEKPTGHTVNESRAMVSAAQKAGTVVQVGLHRRIGPHHVEAMEFLRSGKIGKVGYVKMFVYGKGKPESPTLNSEPNDDMDWDLWCGPAPMRPFCSRIHPGGWRNFLDYANGTMADWGVHWMDQMMWWSEEKGPKSVHCTGGRPIFGPVVLNDKEQTTDAPDHQVATFEFEDFTAVWEHRRFAENPSDKHRIGTCFYGENGMLHVGWKDGWTYYSAKGGEVEAQGDSQLQEPGGHSIALLWQNFIDAIEGKAQTVAGIEAAHRSSCLPLLGMLSWKAGRSIRWDADKEQILGDAEASALLSREYRKPWVYPSA